MKKLLILPLLVLITGCVTYYYPETALEDGVYYAEDDPSYPAPTYVVYAGGYPGVAYPWSSIDYFYMGYYPYPGFSIGYGYPGGFSFGISYAYSPWYYPYNSYGYYSPWYAHHYYFPYYSAWHHYGGYCSYDRHCGHGKKKGHRGDGSDRYAGNGRGGPQGRSGEDPWDDGNNADHDLQDAGADNAMVRRYVSAAPAGYSGNRGMVIRSNESKTIDKSYMHQDQSAPSTPVTAAAAPSAKVATPAYSTKRAANEVRYRSDAKQTRSKTGPVTSGPSSISTTRSTSRPAQASKSTAPPRPSNRSRTVSSRSAGRAARSPGTSRRDRPD